MNGDPHYEVAPMLWNRWDELTGNIRDGVRRRFYTLVDAAGLDEERARAWVDRPRRSGMPPATSRTTLTKYVGAGRRPCRTEADVLNTCVVRRLSTHHRPCGPYFLVQEPHCTTDPFLRSIDWRSVGTSVKAADTESIARIRVSTGMHGGRYITRYTDQNSSGSVQVAVQVRSADRGSDTDEVQFHYDISNDFFKLWQDPNADVQLRLLRARRHVAGRSADGQDRPRRWASWACSPG